MTDLQTNEVAASVNSDRLMRDAPETIAHAITLIVQLGGDHKTAIREQTALGNMLRSRVREYVGFAELSTGDGQRLDKRKAAAAYKSLLDDQVDPFFIKRVIRLFKPWRDTEDEQDSLAENMSVLVSGRRANKKKGLEKIDPLPIWDWLSHEQQRGCGARMLAKIIAEAGRDLSEYHTPAKLWKRFGEHVVDGEAPKARKGQKLGFSKYRRSVSYQLGDCLIRGSGFWKGVYDDRKKFETERAVASGKEVRASAKIPAADNAKPFHKREFMSDGHIHNRAARYMRKKFLEALWQEWTGNHRDMDLPDFITKSS